MSFAIQATIEKLGIAWALRITGIVVIAVNVPACVVLRTRDNYVFPNRKAFDLVLFRRYDVFLFLSWAFVMMFGHITLTYSISDYGRSIDLSSSRAGYQTAFMNLGIAIGRPVSSSQLVALFIRSPVFSRHITRAPKLVPSISLCDPPP
jgi:hypothetical protein